MMQPKKMEFTGILINPFYRLGSLLFSQELDGYPNVDDVKPFLDSIDHKRVKVTIEEAEP